MSASAMGRFNMSPRKGHLKAVKRILAYLKTFAKGRIIVDTTYPDHYMYSVEEHADWKDFYPDSEEEISTDLPKSKGPKVRMTMWTQTTYIT
jgi:hypothetical protein